MKQRFVNHEYFSDKVEAIEYIECQSSGEADWKEPYYANLFYSEFLTFSSKKFPTSKAGDELRSTFDKVVDTCHTKISRSKRKVDI